MRFLPRTFVLASVVWSALSAAPNAAGAARTTSVSNDDVEPGTQTGTASWYGSREAGRRTASGAIFDPSLRSAAHKTLPLGTCVRVTNLGNGRFVIVPIIDRGPYIRGRLIDLSEAAAQVLGMIRTGLAQVRIDVVRSCHKDMKGDLALARGVNVMGMSEAGVF